MKIINIEWETDGEEIDLPGEIDLPNYLITEDYDVASYLSDKYGWLVNSFDIL